MNKPPVPVPQLVYGRVIYWLTITTCIICIVGPFLSMLRPNQNFLNPYFLFASIFEGHSPMEIWQTSGGEFPGGHFYLGHPLTGDGFTHLGMAMIGCSSAAWGLIAAAVCYIRERNRLFAGMCIFVSALILLALSGLVSLKL